MNPRPDTDLIIIGGGCAGLSLASRLARAGSSLSVRILEPRDHYTDDRSWCFWRPALHELDHLVSVQWPGWAFSRDHEVPLIRQARGLSYQYVRSTDFYTDARNAIDDAPRIGLSLGIRADDISRTAQGLAVSTSQGTLTARYIIDTRPPTAQRTSLATLFQCFAGYELNCPDGHGLDTSVAELMTHMKSDTHGFVFSYVLPLDRKRCLVEATRFSFEPLSRDRLTGDLNHMMEQRGWSGEHVIRREFGVLPMGLPNPQRSALPGVYRAGIGAGGLRAASGYGFLRIQSWARECTHRLINGRTPVSHPDESWLRQRLDQVFLRALKAEPERAPDFFMAMASTLRSETFIRFMSDRASLTDLMAVSTSLPPWPFLKAALAGQRSRSRVH